MIYILFLIAALIFIAAAVLESKKVLHMAQLEGYKPSQYWSWLRHNTNIFSTVFIIFIIFTVIMALDKIAKWQIPSAVLMVLWGVSNIYMVYISRNKAVQQKKPLVFTHRAIRLLVFYIILFILLSYIGYIYCIPYGDIITFVFYLSLIKLLLPIGMLLSQFLIYPLEMVIQYKYYRSAQLKIRAMKNLKVIGITGSYGKTSTKYFVKTILSEKYNTIMTPESYNTPMGITRVIREQLKEEHEVFVCEMGARRVGDIKTLCKLANPTIGILTSIGPQHLETFKTIQNVIKTKYELIEALPYYGTAIFNGDNKYCLNQARKTGIETFIYGINSKEEDFFISAEEVRNSKEGLKFRVKGNGIDFECETSLLGKHNVSNILAAICTALSLNLTVEEIQRGIANIKPVPHRLELLKTDNGVTVIDDAFNSNPVGALEALETTRDMEGGSKIVITPGMVELGVIEYEENKKFGRAIANCCDYAILIGLKRSKPIMEGLKEGNFPENNIIVTATLGEATEKLAHIVKAGDIVLFENDLPDNYNEM